MRHRTPPPIEVRNVQRMIRVSTGDLQDFAKVVCALVWEHRQPRAEIASVSEITVLIVSDRRMAALHNEFCGLKGPTDVLTFRHGEIVISAETAIRQARIFHSKLVCEIQLYLLHGLLHLAGFDDVTVQQQKKMRRLQNRLLATALHATR
jgi:probable rRNA maturation factor